MDISANAANAQDTDRTDFGTPIGKQKAPVRLTSKQMAMKRMAELAKAVKKPAPPTPEKMPAPDFEALPSGTRLRVWWEGSQEYYECTILNWRVAISEDGSLFYTHRCRYEGGTFDHDLAKADFEVIDVESAWTFDADDDEGECLAGEEEEDVVEAAATTGPDGELLSPRRRWLAKQESKLTMFQEELENADIGTPVKEPGQTVTRGRLALRRIRLPNAPQDKACMTPRLTLPLDDCDIKIVDPSDAAISYRLCTAGLGRLGPRD